ncbi:MAG: DUF58 domain-containing protein [Ruminococcus sp.]|jgi:uncharacterized protein (DUF58 family)|nr:DUF58 domain-containing protein [Ruminococcus sp.]
MITNIIELLIMAAVSILVALFMSAPVGLTFLLVIVLGLILSFAATISAKLTKAVTVAASVSSPALYKGETAEFTITVKNHTILPVPDLQIKVFTPDGGDSSGNPGELLRFSLAGKREETFAFTFTASHWGQYRLGIESVKMGDFLGIFCFNYQVNLTPEIISVFPNIAEVPEDDAVLTNAIAALWDSPEEETVSSSTPSFSGFPGYNHREYVPGDPIKRINHKLSAKRGVLMLRLDDEAEVRSAKIALSPLSKEDNLLGEEAAIEAVLGYARAFLKTDITADVYIYEDGLIAHECKQEADIKELQTFFAGYKFTNTAPDITDDMIIISALDPPVFNSDEK